MKLSTVRFLVLGALHFPLLWLCLGGIFRTFICLGFGIVSIFLMFRHGWQRDLRKYLLPAALGGLFVCLAFVLPSETEAVSFSQFFGMFFYSIPTGIVLAHYAEKKGQMSSLNWIYTIIILILAAWGVLFISEVDVSQAVRMTHLGVIRDESQQVVELFGLFTYENVIMQIIPFSLYALSSIPAVLCKGPVLQRCILFVSAILGIYVSGTVVTRTPFLAGGMASVGLMTYFIATSGWRAQLRTLVVLGLVVTGLIVGLQAIPGMNDQMVGLGSRFADASDDARRFLWAEAFRLTVQNPVGGGDKLMTEIAWAHDLILDMGLLYGIAGLLGMTAILVHFTVIVSKWVATFGQMAPLLFIGMAGMYFGALITSLITTPDPAFLTPLLFVGSFATERMNIRRRMLRSACQTNRPILVAA